MKDLCPRTPENNHHQEEDYMEDPVLRSLADSLARHREKEQKWLKRQKEWEKKYTQERTRRQEFLDKSEAKPTPVELYALWLYTYLSHGGVVTHHRNYTYDNSGMVTPTNTELPEKSVIIPTGYGSSALHVLNIPRLTPGIDPTPSSNDSRPGREYGHGKLLTLDFNASGQLNAATNDPDVVESWPEVDQLVREMSQQPTKIKNIEIAMRTKILEVESRRNKQTPGTDIMSL